MKNTIRKILPKNLKEKLSDIRSFFNYEKSYSQCGEDLIVKFILRNVMGEKRNISYIDIGANHPMRLSNTYLFYKTNQPNGGGILIEPNPNLSDRLRKYRSKDKVLNIGISPNDKKEKMEFFMCEHDVLSTFSENEKNEYQKMGHKIIGSLQIDTIGINEVIQQNSIEKSGLDLMNLDVEGFDFEILNSMNFEAVRPKVIIVETIFHRSHLEQSKNQKIIDFLISKNYFIYADTYINTIFIDRNYWDTMK